MTRQNQRLVLLFYKTKQEFTYRKVFISSSVTVLLTCKGRGSFFDKSDILRKIAGFNGLCHSQ